MSIPALSTELQNRRQKKAAQQYLSDQLHMDATRVAERNNLSFRNALYDQSSGANSVVEADGRRSSLTGHSLASGTSRDSVNFTKIKVVEGAVGGYSPYTDVKMARGKYAAKKGTSSGGKERRGDWNPWAEPTAQDTRRSVAGDSQYDNPRGSTHSPY
ncbi:hypothetical protein ACOMHN_054783 [Nucella lapillus]